jgi:hypothetical protein
MDLRSGHPFRLLKNDLLADYPSLKHDESCEVVVIGGGITGALARIIHERFCCNRGDESQNPMRYSFFAPRSCKGRSTSQARGRRTWTRSDRRPGRRARRSVGQHPVQGCLPSSRARLWNLPRPLLQGGQPPCRIPTKGEHPLRNSQAGCDPASRLRAPVSLGDCAISRRTVMNNAG